MPTIYYGWDVPSDDDYVKDTAAYMRTLGNDIDATLYTINRNSTPVGLQLINTTNFTTVSSIQVDNVFTTNYTYYKVIFQLNASSTSTAITANFVSSGTPFTSANYIGGISVFDYNSSSVAIAAKYVNQAHISLGAIYATNQNLASMNLEIFNPNNSNYTSWLNSSINYRTPTQYFESLNGGGFMGVTNSFTGIKFNAASGTISGQVKIFGYRDN